MGLRPLLINSRRVVSHMRVARPCRCLGTTLAKLGQERYLPAKWLSVAAI